MAELDALHALLAQPGVHWSRLEIEGRSWRDCLAAREAQLATRRERVGGFESAERELEALGEQEQRWHLWQGDAGLVRAEYELGRELVTVVAEGGRWRRWSPSLGISEGSAPSRPVALMLGPPALSLQAGQLLAQLEVSEVREGTVASRPALSLRATPLARAGRGRLVLREAGAGAEEYRLAVDAERGLLLSLAALRDGRPFHLFETHRVTYDGAIGASRFEVDWALPGPERTRATLPEEPLDALGGVALPFTALLLEPSPSPVAPHAAYFERDHRRLGPAHLVLTYVVVDPERGRGQLRLTEAASPLPRPRPEEWERQGELEVAEATYGKIQRRRVRAERLGLHVELETAVLPLSRLVELVGCLRRSGEVS